MTRASGGEDRSRSLSAGFKRWFRGGSEVVQRWFRGGSEVGLDDLLVINDSGVGMLSMCF